MDFKEMKTAVQRQFNIMKKHPLFRINTDKDTLWEAYLAAFPEGTNPMYKERTEHDCQCCKHFIRNTGNMVAIIDDKVVSLWDTVVNDDAYQVVANALSKIIKEGVINDVYLSVDAKVGTDSTPKLLEDKSVLNWDHFFLQLPNKFVVRGDDIGSKLGEIRTTKEVMLRGLTEITLESIDTVLELISQNSLYRGDEQKFVLTEFRKLKTEFIKVADKEVFCWSRVESLAQSVSRIRGTVIGTLLCDISDGYGLDDCVKSFEQKVAPANYKRPTAVVTKGMIEKAKQTLEELGLTPALNRRYATLEDISINNTLFADRTAKPRMADVFDELIQKTASKSVKNLDKVEEVSIEQFLTNILPQASTVELMFEGNHTSNLVSLIAPVDLTAKTLFKWDNSFSWSYNGDLADSIKERVKQAGGTVDGDLRCSLSWFNGDDLDLHMKEADGTKIFYGDRQSRLSGGHLDVDMNALGPTSRTPVENITYPDRKRMKEGIYKLHVNNFSKRETVDVGFTVEIEFDGVVHTFNYDKAVGNKADVTVAEIEYSKKDGFKILKSLPSVKMTKTVWNIPTQTFHKVKIVMLSPNHWDGHGVGNKHYFFMLENCVNDGTARGFFNEFLNPEFDKHRKVFEIVGNKMRTDEANDQLSGLGFSSTQSNSILCRVTGAFSRIIKINF